jgi:dihydroflavonol-4-reductase
MTKVLVTGASGFIAKHIVRELLDKGYTVRASVRSDKRKAEIEALFPEADLEFATLDLTQDHGWADALDGVDVLMHTASPFPAADPKDPQELIRPAVDGTLRAMRAAQAAGITRVILTSSCAAIYKDPAKPIEAQSTAENWTDPDADFTSAYEASKTLAEKAAWDFVAEHPEMQLTSINPGGVFGPAMDPNFGTSLEIIEDILARKYPMVPNMNLPMVDVRDVAHMHVAAIANPESIGNRYAANAGALSMLEIAQTLNAAFPDRKIPTRKAPDLLVKAMGTVVPLMKMVAKNLGRNSDVDGTPAEKTFGFTYIPSTEAIVASANYIQANR